MLPQRLIVWLLTGGWLYISTPRLYKLLFQWISQTIEAADLAMWNGGDWVSMLCALWMVTLYVAGVCYLVEMGLAEEYTQRIAHIKRAFLLGLRLAIGWWGTRLFIRLFLQGVPDSLSFLIAAFVTALIGAWLLTPAPLSSSRVLRGQKQRTSAEVARKFKRMKPKGFMPWGAAFVEKRNEALHFIIIGNTGAGKSTWLEVMMTITLSWIGIRPDYRAIIVDAKGNILPFLEALGLMAGGDMPLYVILNPLDKRAARWAIGKDINTPGRAHEAACIIIPEVKGDNPFFPKTAGSLLTGVIVSLQRAKGEDWTLRDLINAFSHPAITHALILKWHPRPKDFDDFFKVKKGERNDIFMTIRAELDQYQLIAARWETATNEFSISDWERGEYVLILGADYEYQDALKKVNALLFAFIAARLKQLPDNQKRRVWLFVDELIATGKLVAFEQLLQLGRSKSVCMVSSVLNIASFVEEFGENVAKSIWALSRHKALFPMDSDSAKYVSEAIGKYEGIQMTYAPPVQTTAQPPQSTGISYKRAERATVLPQELDEQNLPQPGPENGLTGGRS